MAKDYIGYEALADRALRMVVRDALARVEKQGLIGGHHFYLTFKTHDPGVDIPDFLKERYPDEMTIVLQHQYWGLKAGDEHFEVTLTFQKLPATLVIPYAALTAFADPGVQFALQFRNATAAQKARQPEKDQSGAVAITPPSGASLPPAGKPVEAQEKTSDDPSGEVVSLDRFRKK